MREKKSRRRVKKRESEKEGRKNGSERCVNERKVKGKRSGGKKEERREICVG